MDMKMEVQLEVDEAVALSYFCKRITYNNAFNIAHGETDQERQSMAYKILDAFSEIEKSLNKLGFAPR